MIKSSRISRWIAALLVLAVMASVLPAISPPALAADVWTGKCGKNLTWRLEDGRLTITGSGDMYDYDPDSAGYVFLDGPTVQTEGAVPWFEDRGSIVEIVLPDGLTHIGSYAFCLTWVQRITIPASVGSIGKGAFYRCPLLEAFEAGSGGAGYCSEDGVLFSRDKTALVQYPAAKEGEYVIPDTVKRIGEDAFDSTRITAVTIQDGVEEIGTGAFSACYRLKSIRIPGSVKMVGDDAFWGCDRMKSAEMEQGVTHIGDGAFGSCLSLETVRIPDSVQQIGRIAFLDCSSLTDVAIPKNTEYIGEDAFTGCDSLQSLNVDPDNSEYSSVDGVLFNRDQTELIRYPQAKQGGYRIPETVTDLLPGSFMDSTGLTDMEIHGGIKCIPASMFLFCRELKHVVIGDGVESIEDSAFSGCISLESITVPDSVKEIGNMAFEACNSLSGIRLPDDLTAISTALFVDCRALKEVKIPEGVKAIEPYAFNGCSGLETVTIPENVTEIGEFAFVGCVSLSNLTIPGGVGRIESNAFADCTGLTAVDIREGVTSIGERAFCNCSSLTDVKIPESVTAIEPEAFEATMLQEDEKFRVNGLLYIGDCLIQADRSVTEVQVRPGTRLIADDAFHSCAKMTSVQLPGSLTEIGQEAFIFCGSLKDVTIPDSVTSIERNTFSGCRSLRNVILPPGVAEVKESAFLNCKSLETLAILNRYCLLRNMAAPDSTTIRGFSGSTAEAYADKHGHVFEALSGKSGFADVPGKAFYADAVAWAVENEVTNGTGKYTFSPDRACTRGQVVTFLWRAAGEPEPTKTENPFTDVKEGAFYFKAVLWAVENGVTKGTSDTTFAPDATCTRGQIVTFFYRANGSPKQSKKDNPFKDVAEGQYFTNAVLWAVENGVTKGKTADEFRPDATCTRGEVVTFLYRAMRNPKADEPDPVEPEPALTEVNAMLIRGPSKNGNDTLPTQTVTVSSAKELQDFLESCYDINHVIGLAADKYSGAYFVNNVLLLTPIRVCGSSPGFTITSVTEKEDQIEVELAKPGDPETPDMCAWVLLIEAAKSMPEREIVIHTTYGERPEYEFTASDTVELMSWINAEIAEPSEKWKYFEDFMNEVKKNNSILIAQPATEAFSLREILVGSFGTTLSIRFQSNDRADDIIAVDISLSDDTLEDGMERVIKSSTKFYEDWTYEKTTAKVNGVDTEIYFWSGDFTIKGSDHKDHFPPTAIFSYMGHVVTVEGCDGLRQAAWDNAWLEQFTFSTVELT